MSAIITSNFRTENANNFRNSIANTDNSVYLFIGKSDAWSDVITDNTDTEAPRAVDALIDINDAWQNAIALKRINSGDVINMIPMHQWTSGTPYEPWDDADENMFSKQFYVITQNYKVYKCIYAPANGAGSTLEPSHTNINPTREDDNYIWKYMFLVSTADSLKFLTNFYIPVKTVRLPLSGTLSAEDQDKYNNQTLSAGQLNGKIYRYKVTNSGEGYSTLNPPTVTVYGNGTGALATAVINNTTGTVTEVKVAGVNSLLNTNAGLGYNVAYVTITGGAGSGAAAQPILSPKNGHGTDPVAELGGYYMGLNIRLNGALAGDFIVDNSFRQIGIVKNPYSYGTSVVATASTLKSLKGLRFGQTLHSGLNVGDYITGENSDAVAFIDSYDAVLGEVRYHQNDKTGYKSFEPSEVINGATDGAATIASSDGLLPQEVQPFTGSVLFLENRAPINRSASQIEDIKVIIEF